MLFLGDSITDAWRNRGLSVWTERYAPLHAANFGIGGDRERTPTTKILLLAIFPRAEKADHPLRQKINEINLLIAKLDDGQHVFFLNINDKFLQSDGTLPRSIMPDFLHPNEEGYRIWGDAMAEKLAQLLK